MSRPHPSHLFIVAHPTVDKDWGIPGLRQPKHMDEIMVDDKSKFARWKGCLLIFGFVSQLLPIDTFPTI